MNHELFPNFQKAAPTTTIEKIRKRDRVAVRQLSEQWGFDEFWKIWPEKKGKATAEAAFVFNLDQPERSELVERTSWYLRRRKYAIESGEWVPPLPHPSTYINQKRWEDQFPTDNMVSKVKAISSNEEANKLMSRFMDEYGEEAFDDR